MVRIQQRKKHTMGAKQLTEEKAVAIVQEAGKDMGLNPSGWNITFDNPGPGASVAKDDPVNAHSNLSG